MSDRESSKPPRTLPLLGETTALVRKPFPSNASPLQALEWAIEVANMYGLESPQLHVLKSVAIHGRRDGICRASFATFRYETRMSINRINKRLKDLCDKGIIRKIEKHRTVWYSLNDEQ